MNIIKSAVASIRHNDPEIEARVELSIAQAEDGSYFVATDSGEDCGPHFDSEQKALDAIHDMYGRGYDGAWDLQWA